MRLLLCPRFWPWMMTFCYFIFYSRHEGLSFVTLPLTLTLNDDLLLCPWLWQWWCNFTLSLTDLEWWPVTLSLTLALNDDLLLCLWLWPWMMTCYFVVDSDLEWWPSITLPWTLTLNGNLLLHFITLCPWLWLWMMTLLMVLISQVMLVVKEWKLWKTIIQYFIACELRSSRYFMPLQCFCYIHILWPNLIGISTVFIFVLLLLFQCDECKQFAVCTLCMLLIIYSALVLVLLLYLSSLRTHLLYITPLNLITRCLIAHTDVTRPDYSHFSVQTTRN